MASEAVRGGMGRKTSLPPPPQLYLPAKTSLIYLSYLPGMGHAGLTAPGPHWQRAVAGHRKKSLLSPWEAGSGQAPTRPGFPPSYLSILNKKASAMAVGALRALATARTADAAHAALAAHAIPVTCCRGQKHKGQSWHC